MDQAWLPIVTGVLGALAVLAGNAIAPFMSSRSQRRDWLRDKRAESCEEFFKVLLDARYESIMQKVIDTSYEAGQAPPIPRLTADQAEKFSARFIAAANLVQLYASPELRLAAHVAAVRYSLLASITVAPSLKPGGRDEAFEDFTSAANKAEQLLRRELHID